MKLFSELVAKDILPALRSIIARELVTTHKLKQEEAAGLMFLTQPAISNYTKQSRGKKVGIIEKNEEVMTMVDQLTRRIVDWRIDEKQIYTELCKIIQKIKDTEIPHALTADELLDCSNL